jgi:hypothetical protein
MPSLRKVPDGGRLLLRKIFLQKPIGKFVVLQLLVYYKGECKWETKQP